MTAAQHADGRPELDEESRRAINAASDTGATMADEHHSSELRRVEPQPTGEMSTVEDALWLALCLTSDEGSAIAELTRVTGMSRPTLYRRLREHARAGRAVQVSRGRWRASTIENPHSE